MGRASVIDGDTIEIHGQRIRFWGIDAPEGRQRCTRGGQSWRCGTDAANALDRFIAARTITCMERDRDRYRRIVAICKVADDIGAWLVRHGWALDYARYSGGTYASHQKPGPLGAPRDMAGRIRGAVGVAKAVAGAIGGTGGANPRCSRLQARRRPLPHKVANPPRVLS